MSRILDALHDENPITSDRRRHDRRRQPTPFFSRYWLFGRRRGGRRDDEDANIYVDRYTAGEWALVISLLFLAVCDLVFTLIHLEAGGREANPVMDLALQGGELTFGLVKMVATVLGLFILLVHVRWRSVKTLLTTAVILYGAVFVYHLYLRFVLA